MKPIVSMPGKNGDLLYAVPVIREIARLYGEPVTLVTSSHCVAAGRLLEAETDCIGEVLIDEQYQPASAACGLQPWQMDIPRQTPHRDILHIGLRGMPLPGETLTESIGRPFQIKPRPGPWLRRARQDPSGPVVFHAPGADDSLRPLAATWQAMIDAHRGLGRELRFVGTPHECRLYQSAGLDRITGARLVACGDLGDVADAMEGASQFCGVASAPAVVAAAVGLPCEWILRPGVDDRWLPRGCDVRVMKPQTIMRPRLVAVGR